MDVDKVRGLVARDQPIELIAERYGISEKSVIEFIAESDIDLEGYSSGRLHSEGEDSIIAAREAYLMSLLDDAYVGADEEME